MATYLHLVEVSVADGLAGKVHVYHFITSLLYFIFLPHLHNQLLRTNKYFLTALSGVIMIDDIGALVMRLFLSPSLRSSVT